jgi:hypothetical protein
VGQAFTCHRDLSIELTDPDMPDTTATLLLREFKTEPFMFKSEGYGQGKRDRGESLMAGTTV